ncbi:alpha/beta hydrolase [uncultured Erythrobacter sp.]|uniref:alpha/beta fold hydrolase n=1 Tax=uncultured Erythrobacter sp. TaxID=263913 RepID=UPI00261473FD|nr:alpha/beta hydrolase [uncultured Erythrobacter sp.]
MAVMVGFFLRGMLLMFAISASVTSVAAVAEDKMMFRMIDGDGGVPLRVVETGNPDGPAILFIHGMAQSTLSFERQLNSDLAKRFRLVAFDLRGHGGSAKPWRSSDYAGSRVWAADVAAVIEALELRDVTIVGWSFGGYVAVSYLRHYGDDRVRGLNLVGTSAGLVEFQPPKNSSVEKVTGNPDSVARRSSLDLAERVAAMHEFPDLLTAEPMEPDDRDASFHSGIMLPAYALRLFDKLPLDNKDLPERLTLPTLISMGTLDIGMDVPSARRLDLALPNSELSLFDGIGHFPAYESTERYNQELADFVSRCD